MRIKKSDAVQASAAGHQLSLLAYHIIGNQKDLPSLQAFSCGDLLFFLLFLLLCVEDTHSLTAVPEDGDPLQALLISVEIQAFCLLHGKAVGDVYRRADRSVDVLLPYRLHIDPLTVIQGHSRHKIIRKLLILFQIMLLHIIFHDLRIYLVIYVGAMERLGLAHIIIGVYRLNAS